MRQTESPLWGDPRRRGLVKAARTRAAPLFISPASKGMFAKTRRTHAAQAFVL